MVEGKILKVSGPLVIAEGMREANMFDVVHVGEARLTGEIIEIQGTGEERPFSKKELDEMYVLAQGGIKQLVAAQKAVVGHLFR